MRTLTILLLFASGSASAIDACGEHGYCAPQGTVHVMVPPDVPVEYQKYCEGASFDTTFSLENGRPGNVVVEGGPEKLHTSIKSSFEKWRYGAVHEVAKAAEKVILEPDCSLKSRGAPW